MTSSAPEQQQQHCLEMKTPSVTTNFDPTHVLIFMRPSDDDRESILALCKKRIQARLHKDEESIAVCWVLHENNPERIVLHTRSRLEATYVALLTRKLLTMCGYESNGYFLTRVLQQTSSVATMRPVFSVTHVS